MTPALIQRYQPGGDIYNKLAAQYGFDAANAIAAAARTGSETNVNAAIVSAKYGAPRETSTLSIFGEQIATDPLGAPLESANRTLGNTFLSFLKSPWVLVTVAAVAFFMLGGADLIRRKMKGQ